MSKRLLFSITVQNRSNVTQAFEAWKENENVKKLIQNLTDSNIPEESELIGFGYFGNSTSKIIRYLNTKVGTCNYVSRNIIAEDIVNITHPRVNSELFLKEKKIIISWIKANVGQHSILLSKSGKNGGVGLRVRISQ